MGNERVHKKASGWSPAQTRHSDSSRENRFAPKPFVVQPSVENQTNTIPETEKSEPEADKPKLTSNFIIPAPTQPPPIQLSTKELVHNHFAAIIAQRKQSSIETQPEQQNQESAESDTEEKQSPLEDNTLSHQGQGEPGDNNNHNSNTPSIEGTIQRACTECESEKGEQEESEDSPAIQTKLEIGSPGDKYEQEADMMAEQVMSTETPTVEQPAIQRQTLAQPDNPIFQLFSQRIQRIVKDTLQPKASTNLENQLNSKKGGGSPLDSETRSFMESRFSADFNKVRVHTDSTAVQMNQQLGAQAFTHGSDIFYGEGKAPGKNKLTAHELTHVVQQGGAVRMSQETLRAKKLSAMDTSAYFDFLKQNQSIQLQPEEKQAKLQKSLLSPQRRAALANVIRQLLNFSKILGEFVAGAVYKWLHHNGQPARWLLQLLVPGWEGLERDVHKAMPRTEAFMAGESFGDGAALATGILEIVAGSGAAGGGGALCITGIGCIAGAPAAAAGVALGLHGTATASSALRSIIERLGIVFKITNSGGGGIDESEKKFSPEERRIAEKLESEGKSVRAKKEINGQRMADAEVNGVPTEFKTLNPGATNGTIKNVINSSIKRGGQARNIIIDARGSGLTEAEAIQGLDRVKNISRGKIDSVRIIGDGFDRISTNFN